MGKHEHPNWGVEFDVMKWSYKDLTGADAFRFAEAGASADQLLRMRVMPSDSFAERGNLLLNEGIQLLEDLLIGAGGVAFSNANAYIGVGDSNTAESASQTGLQASTNKIYMPMDATYPSRSSQTLTFRSTFGTSDANFAWQEWSIANANSNTGTNLNRRVASMGTKASGAVWTLSVTITVS